MTYYVQNMGVVRKTWLRVLNAFMIVMIPFGAYDNKKFSEAFPNENKISYWKCLIEEIEIWKDGFKFGE